VGRPARPRSGRAGWGDSSWKGGLGQLKVDAVNYVIHRLVDIAHRDTEDSIAFGFEPLRFSVIRLLVFM